MQEAKNSTFLALLSCMQSSNSINSPLQEAIVQVKQFMAYSTGSSTKFSIVWNSPQYLDQIQQTQTMLQQSTFTQYQLEQTLAQAKEEQRTVTTLYQEAFGQLSAAEQRAQRAEADANTLRSQLEETEKTNASTLLTASQQASEALKKLRAEKDQEIARAKEAFEAQRTTLAATQAAAAAKQTKIVDLETKLSEKLAAKDTAHFEHTARLCRLDGEQQRAWAEERLAHQEQLDAKDTTLQQTQRAHRTQITQAQREHENTLEQTKQAAQNAHRSMANKFLGLGAGLGIFTVGRSIFSTVMPSLADSTAAKVATGLAAATGAWYLGKSWPSVTMPSFKKVATCGAILGASICSGLSGNFDGMGLRLLSGATLGATAAWFGRSWTARQEAAATIGTTPAAADTAETEETETSSRTSTPEVSHA